MPPTTRNTTIAHTSWPKPVPNALIRKSTAAIFMTAMRPILSASRPAVIAPRAAPSSADATAKPSSALPMPKSSWMESTAPLITALS